VVVCVWVVIGCCNQKAKQGGVGNARRQRPEEEDPKMLRLNMKGDGDEEERAGPTNVFTNTTTRGGPGRAPNLLVGIFSSKYIRGGVGGGGALPDETLSSQQILI